MAYHRQEDATPVRLQCRFWTPDMPPRQVVGSIEMQVNHGGRYTLDVLQLLVVVARPRCCCIPVSKLRGTLHHFESVGARITPPGHSGQEKTWR